MFLDIVLITFSFSLAAIEIILLHGEINVFMTSRKQFFYVSSHRVKGLYKD